MREKEFPAVDDLPIAEFKSSKVRIFEGDGMTAEDLNEFFAGKSTVEISEIAVVIVTNDGVHYLIDASAKFNQLPNIGQGVNRVYVMKRTTWRYWWNEFRLPHARMIELVEKEP